MKVKSIVERILLTLIFLTLVSFHFYSGWTFSQTIPWVQIHSVITGLIVGVLFFGHVFFLYPRYFSRSRRTYSISTGLMLVGCYLLESTIHAFKASALIKDQRGLNFNPWNMVFQPFNLEESTLVVLSTFVVSVVYIYIRGLITDKDRKIQSRVVRE